MTEVHCRKCNPYTPGDYREEILHHFRREQPDEAKALLCGFSEAILKYSFENAVDEPGESEPEPVLTADQVMYREWAASCATKCLDRARPCEGYGWASLAVAWSYLFALKLTQGRSFPGRNPSLHEFLRGATTDREFYFCRCQRKNTLSLEIMISNVHGAKWLRRVLCSYFDKVHTRYLAKSLPMGLQWFVESSLLF